MIEQKSSDKYKKKLKSIQQSPIKILTLRYNPIGYSPWCCNQDYNSLFWQNIYLALYLLFCCWWWVFGRYWTLSEDINGIYTSFYRFVAPLARRLFSLCLTSAASFMICIFVCISWLSPTASTPHDFTGMAGWVWTVIITITVGMAFSARTEGTCQL